MRAVRRIVVLAALAVLLSPGAAYARAGGGSHSFSGGGGGGYHGSGSGGGGYHGSGSGSGGFGFSGGSISSGAVAVLLGLMVLAVLVWLAARAWTTVQRRRRLTTGSDRAAHRSDAAAHTRAAEVEAQLARLAETDETFDPDAIKKRAAWLYTTAQQAWTDRDRAILRQILAPAPYGKWDEELRDYEARGEVNVVEILAGPQVELVDVANRDGEERDTVTVRIIATLRDYVRTGYGTQTRTDSSTRPVEYWTLRKNTAGAWIVASVEQAGEGAHHLTDAIETDGWDQKAPAREAVLEVAGNSTAGGVGDVLSLTGISWSTQADAAAGDLSVVDGRFGTQVLEIAVEQFIEEWVMNDGSLDFTAHRTPQRTVMRNAVIDSIEVRSLVSRTPDPIVFRVAVAAHGVYYEVDRRTEEVLHGDAHTRRPLAFTFDLRLNEAPEKGWTVIADGAQQATV